MAAGYAGYTAWNWHGGRSLGQIRLGDDNFEGSLENGRDKVQEYAVLAISGIIAVVSAVPSIAKILWSSAQSRFGSDRRRHRSAYYDPLSTEGLLSDEEDPLDEEI